MRDIFGHGAPMTAPAVAPDVRLRDALDRLRGVAAGLTEPVEPGDIAQECLDVLAVARGIKPVWVLGRGFADPRWVAGARGVAQALGLRIVTGPLWDAAPDDGALPPWYAAHARDALSGHGADYICRSAAVADELHAIAAAGGRLAIADEARLLDYPECCVAAHYARRAAFHRAGLAMLRRAAGGEESAMRRMLERGAQLEPKTAAERAALAVAFDLVPCPYTSFDMCPSCCADPDGRAARTALRYARLAAEIDPALRVEIARAHGDPAI